MTPPPARPTGPTAADSIAILASAETVWAILSDFAGWQAWNPLYVRSEGRLVPGERLAFTVAVPGVMPMEGAATVYRVEPYRLIEYGLSNALGLLKAFRYIDVVPEGPDRCLVANGEIMTGPMGRLAAMAVGAKISKGMAAMNEALKARAESIAV